MADKIDRIERELSNNGYKTFIVIANDTEFTDYMSSGNIKELSRIINNVYKDDPIIRQIINSIVVNNCIVGRPPVETTKPTEAGC